MVFHRGVMVLASALVSLVTSTLHAEPITLAKDGVAQVAIILPTDPLPANKEAADELAQLIARISGGKPNVIVGAPEPLPQHAIWVGDQPALRKALPAAKLDITEPEEILLVVTADHVAILGRDHVVNHAQTEFGTANAVYTFLQRNLDVRWLWPGELGLDVPQRKTIALEPGEYRFHPLLRERRMRFPRARTPAEVTRWWEIQQRGRGSLESDYDHAFVDWWTKYHEAHPDYFAQQPDGTRKLAGKPETVKLCVSNPAVAKQWLENAEKKLRENPELNIIGASPNDGGGWCVCDRCKSWDHPDAGTDEQGRPILTERYVKFWNILARGLKERFPDRRILLDVMAYSRYSRPPIKEKLDDNITIAYVGGWPLCGSALRERQKAAWIQWAKSATMIKYRPNLFWYTGGVWGFPSVEFNGTIEDMRFIAQNRGVGIDVDSVFAHFATQGPQLYLMAQLAYDPLQDGQAVLDDYYRHGFGPAAGEIAAYFELMQQAHRRIVETDGFLPGMSGRFKVLDSMKGIYSPQFLQQAGAVLDRAAAKAKQSGSELHQRRVAFVRTGLEFTSLQMQIMNANEAARKDNGANAKALLKVRELVAEREKLVERAEPFAIELKRMSDQIERRNMTDYLSVPGTPKTATATTKPAPRRSGTKGEDPEIE